MADVLITGANGFLGAHLTRKALDRGHRVRALCLFGTPADHVANLGAEVVRGDILEPQTLRPAMDGIEVVFHVAGSTLEWHADPWAVYLVHAIGTRNVCATALEAGVKRLVHTSTMSAVGSASAAAGELDEDRLFDLFDTGLYSRSKLLGEMEALRAAARGLDVVVCCPHQILGAGDFGPSTPGRIVVLFAQGRIPFYVNVRSQFVDVDDCAEGHVLAAEKGQRGGRYILAGPEPVDMRTFFAACAEMTGRPVPRFAIPRWMVRIAATPIEWIADHVTRRPPLLTAGNATMLYKDMTCSIRKATEQLGYAPGPWRGALRKAVDWFRGNGYFDRTLT